MLRLSESQSEKTGALQHISALDGALRKFLALHLSDSRRYLGTTSFYSGARSHKAMGVFRSEVVRVTTKVCHAESVLRQSDRVGALCTDTAEVG
jgi:hypothetical protein